MTTLIFYIIMLSPVQETGITRHTSDFVEVNHVYRYDFADKVYRKSMIQIIWWEMRDGGLVDDENGNAWPRTEFVVKDFRVIWSNSSRPQDRLSIIPKRHKGKWVCLFYDKDGDTVREVISGWKRETHTDFDAEVDNRRIFDISKRNKLRK